MIRHLVQVALHTKAQIVSTHFQLFWGERQPSNIFQTHAEAAAAGSGGGLGWPLFPLSDSKRLHPLNRAPPALFGFVGSSLSLTFFSNTAGGANVFIRACVFDALGGFSEYREVGFEDYELHVNAAVHRVHAQVIPAPLLMVRRHVQSKAAKAAANAKRDKAGGGGDQQPGLSMQSSTSAFLNRARVVSRFLDSFSHADASVDVAPLLQVAWGLHDASLRASSASGVRASSGGSAVASGSVVDLADSVRDFSGVQGQFGWWYALLMTEGDEDAAQINPNILRRALQTQQQLSEEEKWAASGEAGDPPPPSALQLPALFSASFVSQPFPHWGCAPHARSLCPPKLRDHSIQSWPHHCASSVHPAIAVRADDGASLILHTVRRWVSNFQGPAVILVSLQSEARQCGHGVVYSLYVERNRIFTHDEQAAAKQMQAAAATPQQAALVGFSGTMVDVTLDDAADPSAPAGPHCSLVRAVLTCVGVSLRVGSEVDLIVSPGINDWCDATTLRINIQTAT